MEQMVILAHNYVRPEVQSMADFVGDSLELARKVREVEADYIVLAGVDFMAEMAALLSPDKKIIHPEPCSKCALAARVKVNDIVAARKLYPDATVVTYVNSSAVVKAASDIICTSSNAVRIVNSVPSRRVIFVPDRNLARYVASKTDKEIIAVPEQGCCPVHQALSPQDITRLLEKYPEAKVMVHPECPEEVIRLADFVGSTSALLHEVKRTSAPVVVIGTEAGVIYQMEQQCPQKTILPASPFLVCPDMKMITKEKVLRAIAEKGPVVQVDEIVAAPARQALERMLTLSAKNYTTGPTADGII